MNVAAQSWRPTRAMLEASIEAAIALLDAMDGDPDLEDSHDREAVDEREPDGYN